MPKGQVLTTKDLPKTGTSKMVDGPTTESREEAGAATTVQPKAGYVRLQQTVNGTVCYGGTSTKSANGRRSSHTPAYKWTGKGVQTVPIAIAREILCKFRQRFRSLDPL